MLPTTTARPPGPATDANSGRGYADLLKAAVLHRDIALAIRAGVDTTFTTKALPSGFGAVTLEVKTGGVVVLVCPRCKARRRTRVASFVTHLLEECKVWPPPVREPNHMHPLNRLRANPTRKPNPRTRASSSRTDDDARAGGGPPCETSGHRPLPTRRLRPYTMMSLGGTLTLCSDSPPPLTPPPQQRARERERERAV